MGTWHDPDLGRPIAAPLERCAELLGVDLATVRELAAKVDPYLRADGTAVALWIAAGASPKEVAARAGHTSVSFTLDRYGHLYPESDAALRDRLDAIYSTGEREEGAAVVELFRERSLPQQGPGTQ